MIRPEMARRMLEGQFEHLLRPLQLDPKSEEEEGDRMAKSGQEWSKIKKEHNQQQAMNSSFISSRRTLPTCLKTKKGSGWTSSLLLGSRVCALAVQQGITFSSQWAMILVSWPQVWTIFWWWLRHWTELRVRTWRAMRQNTLLSLLLSSESNLSRLYFTKEMYRMVSARFHMPSFWLPRLLWHCRMFLNFLRLISSSDRQGLPWELEEDDVVQTCIKIKQEYIIQQKMAKIQGSSAPSHSQHCISEPRTPQLINDRYLAPILIDIQNQIRPLSSPISSSLPLKNLLLNA